MQPLHTFWGTLSASLMMAVILLLIGSYAVARKSSAFRKPFVIFALLVNLVYLAWRAVYTLPLSYGVLSILLGVLLLLAECMGFFQAAVYRLLFLKPYRLATKSAADWPELPSVDVFVATYNESMTILEKTLMACLNLDYPADRLQIYLCDDGRRDEAKALCETLGVRYLTREDRANAKAGNLNNALLHSQGDFVLLLDADMIPKSTFLQKTIGYFMDERMGFVQTPQVFYNPDPFQFNLRMNQRIPNEQDFFMFDIEEARAGFNAVLHVGTNAIFRRKALEDIGGIPTGTITEDMATGMLLQAKGYQSVFLREVLCTGLTVERFSDLIRQRERWCRGNIQVSKKWNPLTIRGLSPMQRLIYLDGLVYWFFGVQKMIYLLCPLIYLAFGTMILRASVLDLLLFWVPSYLASMLSHRALTHKSRSLFWSHIYEVAMAPYLASAALMEAIFARPVPFHVTPKGLNANRTTFAVRLSIPFLLILGLTAAGWVVAWPHIAGGIGNPDSVLVNLAWSVYNAVAVILSLMVCVERPRRRIAERVKSDEPITMEPDAATSCRLVDVSETGAKIVCDSTVREEHVGDEVRLKSDSFGEIDGKVVWVEKSKDKQTIAVSFGKPTMSARRGLIRIIGDRNKGYKDNLK